MRVADASRSQGPRGEGGGRREATETGADEAVGATKGVGGKHSRELGASCCGAVHLDSPRHDTPACKPAHISTTGAGSRCAGRTKFRVWGLGFRIWGLGFMI